MASNALSVATNPAFDDAKALQANQLEVARYYTVDLISQVSSTAVLDRVTHDPASVALGKADAVGGLIDLPGPASALTTDQDTGASFAGDAANLTASTEVELIGVVNGGADAGTFATGDFI